LDRNPEKRLSAQQALKHNWIINNTENIVIGEQIRSDALKELSNFRGKLKMQQAAMTFISTHLINNEE